MQCDEVYAMRCWKRRDDERSRETEMEKRKLPPEKRVVRCWSCKAFERRRFVVWPGGLLGPLDGSRRREEVVEQSAVKESQQKVDGRATTAGHPRVCQEGSEQKSRQQRATATATSKQQQQ